jgi:ABC-2 type transport system permease protein
MVRQIFDLLVAMVRKNLLVMLRYPLSFASSFITLSIVVLIFLFATLMFTPGGVAQVATGGSGQRIGGTMLYGLVLFLFVSDTLWSIGYNVRWEQQEGTLESLYLTPASRFLYLVSRLAVPLFWTGLNAAVVLAFIWLLLGPLPTAHLGLALYTLICTLAGIFGFGFCFAAFTLLVKESAQSTANLAQFALMVVCAMFFPFSALPPVVRAISRVVPLSYGVDLFRSALLGFPPGFPELASPAVEVAIVTAWGVLMPLVGYAAYRRAEHHVRITGGLAEF